MTAGTGANDPDPWSGTGTGAGTGANDLPGPVPTTRDWTGTGAGTGANDPDPWSRFGGVEGGLGSVDGVKIGLAGGERGGSDRDWPAMRR